MTAPDGTTLVIPAGALSADVAITIQPNPGAPTPSNATVVGTPYRLGPEGQTFLKPYTLTESFEPSRVPSWSSAAQVVVLTAPQDSPSYQALATTLVDPSHVRAQATHFSNFVPAVPGPDAGSSPGGRDAGADATTADGGDLLTGVTAIASGQTHTCALLSNGTVECWGANGAGELGNGTTISSTVPTPVANITNAIAIAAGGSNGTMDGEFTCAVLADGTVQCWGDNTWDDLGDGTAAGPNGSGVGPETCPGGPCSTTPVAVANVAGATAIATGDTGACALLAQGAIACWGRSGAEPSSLWATPTVLAGVAGATQISAGDVFACALLAGGAVDCVGSNTYGELGNGTTTDSLTPTQVSALTGATALSSSFDTTCVILAGGTVDCWGYNGLGELGSGTANHGFTVGPETCGGDACATTPTPVPGLSGATAIAVGADLGCALLAGGTVTCWGDDSPAQVPVPGLSGVVAISAGGNFACGLLAGGTVECWGGGGSGQLGSGTTSNSATPVPVVTVPGPVTGGSFGSSGGASSGGPTDAAAASDRSVSGPADSGEDAATQDAASGYGGDSASSSIADGSTDGASPGILTVIDGGPVDAASCQIDGPGLSDCGDGGESCCASLEVPGATFYRTYANSGTGPTGETDPATVSDFRLDKYDVTVGRFRRFVQAVLPADGGIGWSPPEGSGIHTHLHGGLGLVAAGASVADGAIAYETGWSSPDNTNIAPTDANLTACGLASTNPFATWTTAPSANEDLPINCVNWWESYAFCIWDGGFLPSEAEWEYAAAGGSLQGEYPWGIAAPGMANQYAIYGDDLDHCFYPSGTAATCSGAINIAPVGTAAAGAGAWGQLDLVGNMYQWNLDWDGTYVDPCVDCANLSPGTNRAQRGGAFLSTAAELAPAAIARHPPGTRAHYIGVRCARIP